MRKSPLVILNLLILLISITIGLSSILYAKTAENYINSGKQNLSNFRAGYSENYAYKAIQDFNKALQIEPNNIEAFIKRAEVKRLLADNRGAISDYDKAIKIDPNYKDGTLYWLRAGLKCNIGDYKGGIADYNLLINMHLNESEHYSHLYGERGYCKFEAGDIEGGFADYSLEIKLKPKDATNYYYRAYKKEEYKDYKGAIEDYTIIIEDKLDGLPGGPFCGDVINDYSIAYRKRGEVKLKLNQKDSGCLDLSKAGEFGDNCAYNIIRKYCN